MILKENQYANVCVRGLIIEQDELVITEWTNRGEGFLIGGRIEYGEPLAEALVREIEEETHIQAEIVKLIYFSENIFTFHDGRQFHEYGWYFLVKTEQEICPNGCVLANPDDPKLQIRRVPLTAEGLSTVWPRFLRNYLPKDYGNNFADCPRALHSDPADQLTDYTHVIFGK